MEASSILIVDDEAGILELYESYLKDSFEVITANSGTVGLEKMDESIDLVLLDRRMPGMNGDEVLQELRDRGFVCPIIMVTAVSPDRDIAVLPFNEYLTKPVSRQNLHDAIDRVMDLSDRELHVQEFFALMDKKLALEHQLDIKEFWHSEEYEQLIERMDEIKEATSPPISPIEEDIAKRLAQKWPDAEPGRRPNAVPDD